MRASSARASPARFHDDDVGQVVVADGDGVVVAAHRAEHAADGPRPDAAHERQLGRQLVERQAHPVPQAVGEAADLGERPGPLGLDAERVEPPGRAAGEALGARRQQQPEGGPGAGSPSSWHRRAHWRTASPDGDALGEDRRQQGVVEVAAGAGADAVEAPRRLGDERVGVGDARRAGGRRPVMATACVGGVVGARSPRRRVRRGAGPVERDGRRPVRRPARPASSTWRRAWWSGRRARGGTTTASGARRGSAPGRNGTSSRTVAAVGRADVKVRCVRASRRRRAGSMPNVSASAASSSSVGRSSGPEAASTSSGSRLASLVVLRNSRGSDEHEAHRPADGVRVGQRLVPG